MIRRDKPRLIVLCPPCTKFSRLLQLRKYSIPRAEWLRAVRMVNVAVRCAELQLDGNRHFVFEHPLAATSWKLRSLRRLRARAGVVETTVHMCMFGLTSKDALGVAPAMKPTRIVTSSAAIRDSVRRLCDHKHRHVQLLNGRAAAAQEYAVEFCDAILDGLQLEFLSRGQEALSVLPASAHSDVPAVLLEVAGDDGHVEHADGGYCFDAGSSFVAIDGTYINDITGGHLEPGQVQEGRREELVGFDKRGVYDVVDRSWAEQKGVPVLGTRWVDKQKGSRVRSRLCVQDFNFRKGKTGPEDLFAPTPPLAAARYTASRAATGPRFPRQLRRHLMALDFEKAFLNSDIEREVCIVLPQEDSRGEGGRRVGLLRKAMYGLREAPMLWQKVVRRLMGELGFKACTTIPCMYYHPGRDLVVVAHVDDFLVCGSRKELITLRTEIKDCYDCDGDILGDDSDDQSEITFLGRRLVWTSDGIEWLGDCKLVQGFLERAGFDEARPGASVETPGVKHDKDPEALLMDDAASTRHRGLVALLNYIAQDRADLSFAAKELSQSMARPRLGDDQGVKRVARYLRCFPACALVYRWQAQPASLTVYTDADWGGCVQTRRSTSGGLILHGDHLLTFWARTQQCLALSSCESEVNALVKGGVEGLGIKHMAEQCGNSMQLELRTDAAAAQGLCARQGAGRVKHLTVRQLWAQEREAMGDLKIVKVPRAVNCADMFTHHWSTSEGHWFLQHISIRRLDASSGIQARRRVGVCLQEGAGR